MPENVRNSPGWDYYRRLCRLVERAESEEHKLTALVSEVNEDAVDVCPESYELN